MSHPHISDLAREAALQEAGNLHATTEPRGLYVQEAIDEACAPLVEAADALVKQMDAVHSDAQYQGVWTCYMIHGGDYRDGIKYEHELERLRLAIASHHARTGGGK